MNEDLRTAPLVESQRAMLLADVRERKQAMDRAIQEAVQGFYDATGLQVDDVRLSWFGVTSSRERWDSVTVRTEARL